MARSEMPQDKLDRQAFVLANKNLRATGQYFSVCFASLFEALTKQHAV